VSLGDRDIYRRGGNQTQTYHSRVDERGPVIFTIEKSKDKRDGGGAQEDENQLVLELLQHEFP
jgi:hypothetical protein